MTNISNPEIESAKGQNWHEDVEESWLATPLGQRDRHDLATHLGCQASWDAIMFSSQ